MTDPRIEQSTLDAWRISTMVSLFLFFLSFGALAFGVQNETAMRRCLTKNSGQADLCMLTVYGR